MRIAAEGHITTEALMWNQNINQKTISGMVVFCFKNNSRYRIIIKYVSSSMNVSYELNNIKYYKKRYKSEYIQLGSE